MTLPAPSPHGGALVDLRVQGSRAVEVAAAAELLPGWELTRRQRCDLELLATGGFSPLRTFLDWGDYLSVCAEMRLTTGELWPVPVVLDLPEHVVEAAWAAGGLTLRARGTDVAVLWVRSLWRPDRLAEAHAVLGTTDPAHPGVRALLEETHPWYVSGPLEVLQLPAHAAFRSLRHTPAELRRALAERGWDRVVAFQTRNPMHRAHQELTVRAARDLGAHLLLHPVVGITKPGDVDPYTRVRCYRALLPSYPPGTALLSLLPLAMRMAGPREALWHAIVRKNHGATHFIVGRDHAGPGTDAHGRPFYDAYAAQDLVGRHEAELGIGVVPFRQMLFVPEVQGYVPEDELAPGHRPVRISGTEQRARLARGEELPAWFTPPEVAAELRRTFPAPAARGIGVVVPPRVPRADRVAAAVAAQLREAGRTVTLLDGFVWSAGGASARLVTRLLGELLRNGGAVVCSGDMARCLAAVPEGGPGAEAARPGVVLELVEEGGDAGEDADGKARIPVPRGAAPELVADVVCHRLWRLGYVAAPPATEPPAPAADLLPAAASGVD